jgi:hypothetical protein
MKHGMFPCPGKYLTLLLAVPAYKQCTHYTPNVFHRSKNTKIFKTAQISPNGKQRNNTSTSTGAWAQLILISL